MGLETAARLGIEVRPVKRLLRAARRPPFE